MVFNVEEYGIVPDTDISVSLNSLLEKMSETEEEKVIVFKKGTYYINSDNCRQRKFYITNTVADEEYSKDEIPHLSKAAISFNSIKNLVFQANGSTFVIDGKCTNISVENCENITLDGLIIDVKNPGLNEVTVEKVNKHSVEFSIDKDSTYICESGKYYFTGKGFKRRFYSKSEFSAPARVRKNTPDKIERVKNPFASCLSVKEISPRKFKAIYFSTRRFLRGDRFYLFSTRRDCVGIFVDKCKNFVLKNTKQCFNYSLALVCQRSENITVENVDFSPSESSGKLMSSLADFIQICMCKGEVRVTGSNFCGACDDVINVHGINMIIEEIRDNKLKLAFKHPQTHGFNPFCAGDGIKYVDAKTLEDKGEAEIISSELIDEYTVEVCVDSVKSAQVGEAVEDITLCPDLYFSGNTLKRITTRGVLVTTRGKVVIENNLLSNFTMAGVLLSDDAKSWYESGACHNVTVRNNVFEDFSAEYITVLPENAKNINCVHKNIKIENNKFNSDSDRGIYIKCAENVCIENNKIIRSAKKDGFIRTVNCRNFKSDI